MNRHAPEPAAPWSFAIPAQPGDQTLLVVGDCNLLDRPDPASAFAGVAATLAAAGGVIGQCEGMLTDPSQDPDRPDIPFKSWWRHSERRMAEGFRAANFRALACASNVAWPPRACADTAETLAAHGLGCAGVGSDEAAARAPAVFTLGAMRIGLLSYTSVFQPHGQAAGPHAPGCATLRAHTAYQPDRRALEMPGADPIILTWPDPDALAAMIADIRALRARVDVAILSCHWGVSGAAAPADYQRAVARAAVAAGADLVFGHHPHVVQGAEVIDGRPVFHSLGNFAFDGSRMIGRHLDGLMLRLLLRAGRLADVAAIPVRRGADNIVRIADPAGAEGARIAAEFADRSAALGCMVKNRERDMTVTAA